MISFCLLIASTVPHHTDALRLIDDVGLGGWGGVNNVPLDIHLHDDFFLLIASTVPCHTDALRLIDDVGLGWGGSFIHSFIHSFHFMSCHVMSFHFIHSFIHSAEQAACTAEERVHNRVNLCACTGEANSVCTAEAPPFQTWGIMEWSILSFFRGVFRSLPLLNILIHTHIILYHYIHVVSL